MCCIRPSETVATRRLTRSSGSRTGVSYRANFDITVGGDPREIASVVILRSDRNTHSLTAGDRNVQLAFRQMGSPAARSLRVVTPKLPSRATPGIYLLFVVDKNGVPSVGRKLVLAP